MKVTPKAVRDLARNAGVPEEIILRHTDELINFTFAVAKRERKSCRQLIKKWIHSEGVIKPDLLTFISEELENEDELYDIL